MRRAKKRETMLRPRSEESDRVEDSWPAPVVEDAVLEAVVGCSTPAVVGRLTTRVSWVTGDAAFSGQHGTDPLPGWRSAGYAPGQNSGEILHNSDI